MITDRNIERATTETARELRPIGFSSTLVFSDRPRGA
jgi:hypothetical protein